MPRKKKNDMAGVFSSLNSKKTGFPTRWKNTLDKQRFQATLHQK